MASKQPGRPRHAPQRTCIVCRGQFDKRRLTRIVRATDRGVVVDPTGKLNGRGAYVCDQAACWDKLVRHAGLLNQALNAIGISDPPYWLSTPGFSMLSVAVFGIWSSIGFNVIILSAGLKGIPRELYEAAELDGASAWRQFRSVTVPLLTPSIFFLTIMQAISGFQLFDALYAMMGQGNPAMNESRSLVYLFYNEAFVLQNKAGGAAIAMFIVVLVGIMTAFQFWAQKKWVHYG